MSDIAIVRDAKEWREYIKDAERGSVDATLEWCRRVHEAKQAYGGSFRAWADEWYAERSYSVLCKLAGIGLNYPRMLRITQHRELPDDWQALYSVTTLTDDEIAELPALDQKSIKDFKQAKKRGDFAEVELIATGEPPWDLILADPPWSYDDKATSGGHWAGAENHYGTMSIDELCDMRLSFNGTEYHASELAADDAELWLWTTWPFLQDAFKVIEAWGFTYKTLGFIWTKTNADGTPYMGLGNGTRLGSEPCLRAVKGKGLERVDAGVNSDIRCPRTAHSAKPYAQYEKIDRLYGPKRRLEIFGRTRHEGWDVFGNQVQEELAYGN
jgi:N6-adenosine-specific RNA methylase IME4